MAYSRDGIIPLEAIERRFYILRGHRVMLDRDLAELYSVSTRVLNQAVKRNQERFPSDFMFRLTDAEARAISVARSQNVTLKRGGNLKYSPCAFTEHGAVMLASVLKSKVAVQASIQVLRAFVHLRQMIATDTALGRRLEALEKKGGKHDADLVAVLAILQKRLEPPPAPPRRRRGIRAVMPLYIRSFP